MIQEELAINGGRPVRDSYLIFGKPDIREEEIQEVIDCLRSGWVGTGPRVAKFQEKIKSYVNATHALAVNSCTAGLHLSMIASNLGPGDEVITTPMTFAATANVIEHVGATPIFADCKSEDMLIDPHEIEKKITPHTKAIVPVHLAGRSCDMDPIMRMAKARGLKVISDAAHALGSEYKGKKIGSFSDFTVFSFYATKNLVTAEGGMVTTSNEEGLAKLATYSLHGMSRDAWKRYSDAGFKHYLVEAAGFKYNMTDMQAAIGLRQMDRFEAMQTRRKEIWHRYMRELQELPIDLPAVEDPASQHSYHLFTIFPRLGELKADRDTILQALHKENIGVGVHYVALHLHPYYQQKYGYKRGDFPNAENISDRTISIPMGSNLSDTDVSDVIYAIRKVLSHYKR
ncbi:MAG: DegT/DnrJ/EryC1/StrS family aminotransferase [Bacteriovoracia bacterium]